LPAVGERISAALVYRLREAAVRKQIAKRVFRLLDRRLYSLATLRSKLQQEGFDADAVGQVLAGFVEAGVHSDHQFAAAYCRDSLRRRPVGPHLLRAQLRSQGVTAEVADKVLSDLLPTDREVELAHRAGRERWRKLAKAESPGATAKVYRFLLGRGFSPALARQAAHATANASGEDAREDET
jgi:regulatory protein